MLINIIFFVLALSLIISIHELGHLITAKMFGVYCYEYSIGMGPKIFSKKFKETIFSIRAIPFGGYVAMAGENDDSAHRYDVDDIPHHRTLIGISKPKRVIIMLAGIFMNFVLAYVIIVGLIASNGVYYQNKAPIIEKVVEGMPAAKADFKTGDLIVGLKFNDGTNIDNPKTIMDVINYVSHKGGNVEFKILRDGKIIKFNVDTIKKDGQFVIGIQFKKVEPTRVNLFNIWGFALDNINDLFRNMIIALTHLIRGIGLKDVSGPVGIYKISADAARQGFKTYFNLIAILSLNIGIMNALPIPALDGGRVLLVIVEAIIGKPLNKRLETFLIAGSMMFLLGLIALVTVGDIIKLF